MNAVDVQANVIRELRTIVGGPASLRWPSHLLVPALASAAGTMCALTLRTSNDFIEMYALGAGLVTESMRTSFQLAEPSPQGLAPLAQVAGIRDEILLRLGLPQPYKKPSNLVLGAIASVLVQLAELRGTTRDEVLALVDAAQRATPKGNIRFFQKNKAPQRNW